MLLRAVVLFALPQKILPAAADYFLGSLSHASCLAHVHAEIITMSILLETTFGDVVIDLDVDGSPSLCRNVLKLTKARFYTNTLIYNVVPGRYCQMGGEFVMLVLL